MSQHPERDVICGSCGKAPPKSDAAITTCPWCGAVAQWIGDPASWHRPQPAEEPPAPPVSRPIRGVWKTSKRWTHRHPTHHVQEGWSRGIRSVGIARGVRAQVYTVGVGSAGGFIATAYTWDAGTADRLIGAGQHKTLEAAQTHAWKAAVDWAKARGYVPRKGD